MASAVGGFRVICQRAIWMLLLLPNMIWSTDSDERVVARSSKEKEARATHGEDVLRANAPRLKVLAEFSTSRL